MHTDEEIKQRRREYMKLYMRRYRVEHKDKCDMAQKRFYERHPDKRNEYTKRYWEKKIAADKGDTNDR